MDNTKKEYIMQHWNKLLFGVGIIIVFIMGCTTEQNIQEPIIENIPESEEDLVVEEPVIEPEIVKKEEFQIFNPVLTYSGAYNGPLYATSEQVGSASMDSYFRNLDRNGINFFIGMFGISGEPTIETLTSDQGLGEVIDAVQKHPKRVIPFFNPGIGGEEVERYLGETWIGWYKNTLTASKRIAGNDFIKGFGEVETQEWSIRHNNPKILLKDILILFS